MVDMIDINILVISTGHLPTRMVKALKIIISTQRQPAAPLQLVLHSTVVFLGPGKLPTLNGRGGRGNLT